MDVTSSKPPQLQPPSWQVFMASDQCKCAHSRIEVEIPQEEWM